MLLTLPDMNMTLPPPFIEDPETAAPVDSVLAELPSDVLEWALSSKQPDQIETSVPDLSCDEIQKLLDELPDTTGPSTAAEQASDCSSRASGPHHRIKSIIASSSDICGCTGFLRGAAAVRANAQWGQTSK